MSGERLFEEPTAYREAMNRGDWDQAISSLEARRADGGGELPAEETIVLATLLGLRGETEEAVRILDRIAGYPDRSLAVRSRVQSSLLRLSQGAVDDAGLEAALEEAARLAGEDPGLTGLVQHAQSRLFWRRGEFDRAGSCLERARALLEEAGDEENLAKVLDSLALSYELSGQYQRAISCYSLSLSKKAQWRDLYGVAVTLGNLGRLHLRMSDPETALACLRDDLKIARQLGDLRAQVVVRINIGQALTELGRVEEAERELEEALEKARDRGWREQQVYALKDLARAVARRGDSIRARELLNLAVGLVPSGGAYVRGQVFLALGEVALEQGDLAAAEEGFKEAHGTFSALRAHEDEARAFHGLARLAERRGDYDSSRRYVEEGIACDPFLGSATAVLFQEVFEEIEKGSEHRPVPPSIGPYRITGRLGAGAYADVYKAVEEAAGRPVAIKCLRFDEGECDQEQQDRLARFERECGILTGIDHPNVVHIISFGKDPCPYLVMEYLAGGDLRRLIKECEPLPVDYAVCLARGILSGLAVLHSRQVVHRDLKPANVLLRARNEPVIVDFGMARMLAQTAMTLRSTVLGTMAYMPPEQLRGPEVDDRADIYALGGILYHLLGGRPPLEATTLPEMVAKIQAERPEPLGSLRPDVHSPLAAFVDRCLEKEPDKRYGSAVEALAAIDAVAIG